jgi:hypothetical protein
MHSWNYRVYPKQAQRISASDGTDFIRWRISQIQRLKQHSRLYAKYVRDNQKKQFSAGDGNSGLGESLLFCWHRVPKYGYASRLGILRAWTTPYTGSQSQIL